MTPRARLAACRALVVLLSVLPVWAYMGVGLPNGHNVEFQPIRVLTVLDSWTGGILVPRWAPALAGGLGYPLWVYYGWAPYALAAVAAVPFGGDPSLGLSLATVLIGLVSGVGAWGLGRTIGGRAAGVACAAVYVLAPYHLLNLHVRASFSEYAGAALLPWALLAVRQCAMRQSFFWPLLLGAVAGLLAFTHNTTAFIAAPVIAGFGAMHLLFLPRRRRAGAVARVAVGGVLALGLSLHFWAPLIVLRNEVNLASVYDNDLVPWPHFLGLSKLFFGKWDFGYSVAGPDDGMSFAVGPAVLGAVIMAAAGVAFRNAGRQARALCTAGALGAVAMMMLTLGASETVWRVVKPLQLIQFPWRLLLFAALFAAVGAAAAIRAFGSVRPRAAVAASVVLVAAAIVALLPRMSPQGWVLLDESMLRRITTNSNLTTTISDDYRPVAATAGAPMGARNLVMDATGRVLSAQLPLPAERFRLTVDAAGARLPVTLPVYYYPGWTATSAEGTLPIAASPGSGLLLVGGDGTASGPVTAEWRPTPFMRTCDGISAALWLIVITGLFAIFLCRARYRLRFSK